MRAASFGSGALASASYHRCVLPHAVKGKILCSPVRSPSILFSRRRYTARVTRKSAPRGPAIMVLQVAVAQICQANPKPRCTSWQSCTLSITSGPFADSSPDRRNMQSRDAMKCRYLVILALHHDLVQTGHGQPHLSTLSRAEARLPNRRYLQTLNSDPPRRACWRSWRNKCCACFWLKLGRSSS